MARKIVALAPMSALLLTGCMDTGEFGSSGGSGGFGGSGGSNEPGLSLARDACILDVRDRGESRVRVESSKNVGSGPAYAQVTLQSRRGGSSANTSRWSCRFSYTTGRPTTTRI